jgi:PKD repeat protein
MRGENGRSIPERRLAEMTRTVPTRETKESPMSWFVNRIWPRRRAIAVAGIVAVAVMEPWGMAWATKGLVANGGAADTVTLFDAVTGSAITIEYPFFKRPRWIAVTDDGRFAGVTNGAGKTITWLDVRDRSAPVVLGKTFVDANPKGIAIKGSVAVVALDNPVAGGMDSVKIIAIGALPNIPREIDITSLDLGADANPEGVALTPDGRFGLITRAGVKKLAYVDLTGLTPALLAGGTKVATGAFGITVTPDGTRALVTNKTGGTLSIVNLTGLPVAPGPAAVTTFAVGDSPGAVAVTPDGRTAVVAEAGSSDAARLVDLAALTSTTVPLATATAANPDPFGVAIMAGPGGPLAAIADTAAGTVSIVDLTSQTVVHTIDAGPGPQGLAMLPVKAPKAGLSTESSSGAVPLAVTFDGTKSSDRDGVIVSYTFTFGDGTSVTSAAPVVTHTYTTVGKFVASLVVTDDGGAPSTAVLASVQVAPNKPPKAALKASETTGKAPFLVTFDASRSKDSDGTIASYTFTFGDGSSATTSNPVVIHTYVSAGKYTAAVVITDNAGGASSPATTGVEATPNKPPTAAFRAQPSAGTAPLPVTFTDQSKDPDGHVVAVRWDFGDGVTSTERNPTHLYTAPGKFVVTLTATDDNGATAQKTGKAEVRAK